MRLIAPITWYGGKTRLAAWLRSYYPEHTRFVEPFGGSGVLTLNSDARERVYADLDERVVNFMRCLRDDVRKLTDAIRAIPPTIDSFRQAVYRSHDDGASGAAWLFFKCKSTYSGSPERMGGFDLLGAPGKFDSYVRSIGRLPFWSERMQNVAILHGSYETLFERFDSLNTLWLFDPPYPKAMRTRLEGYRFEMSDGQHRQLLERIRRLRGRVMITTYLTRFVEGIPTERNAIYSDGLKDWWFTTRPTFALGIATYRQETLFCNFNPTLTDSPRGRSLRGGELCGFRQPH